MAHGFPGFTSSDPILCFALGLRQDGGVLVEAVRTRSTPEAFGWKKGTMRLGMRREQAFLVGIKDMCGRL